MSSHVTVAYRAIPHGTLFASLSADVAKELFGAQVASRSAQDLLIVELTCEGGDASAAVAAPGTASSSSTSQPAPFSSSRAAFVGVAPEPLAPATSRRTIALDPAVAAALGLRERQQVVLRAVALGSADALPATRVFVEPATVNDSEVAEENATFLEMALLQMARVVFKGQRVPVPLPSGTRAELRVTSITVGADDAELPAGRCAVLTPGCELCIATKARAATAANSDGGSDGGGGASSSSSSSPSSPRKAVLRILDIDLVPQCRPAAGSGGLADDAPVSTALLLLVVSRETAAAHRWQHGARVGLLDLAFWADALVASGSAASPLNAPTSAAARRQQQLLLHGGSAAATILSDPALLRRSATALVHVVTPARVAADGAVPPPLHCAVLLLPPQLLGRGGSGSGAISNALRADADGAVILKREGPTCMFCWPMPADSPSLPMPAPAAATADTAALAAANGIAPMIRHAAPPTLAALCEVHGAPDVARLARLVAGGDGCFGALRRAPRVLITGSRGGGRSALALRCAVDSGRHVVVVECAAARADFARQLAAALLECVMCGPSCLVLEDVEHAAGRERDLASGGGGGPGSSGSVPEATRAALAALEGAMHATASHVAYWYTANFADAGDCCGSGSGSRCDAAAVVNDTVILATAKDADAIHSRIARHSSTPFGFAAHHRIPLPNLAARTALVRQIFAPATTAAAAAGSAESDALTTTAQVAALATDTDHFAPADMMLLLRAARRAVRDAESSGNSDNNSAAAAAAAVLDRALRLVRDKTVVPIALANVHFLNRGKRSDGGGGAADLTWDSVGGLARARATLHECIVLPCRYPQIFDLLPLKARSGVLLYGPSGCGKSHLVACLAAAEKMNCIVVNGPEILDKYIGASEAKVRDVFERAQAAAPCILFLDEFDSIAPQRGRDNTGVTDRVVNQLLCYLDGVEARSKVYVVGASSRPDLIDAALLRPGRLDRHVLCGFPAAQERRDILQSHVRRGLPGGEGIAARVDLGAIADRCERWTGADLAALVTSAGVAYAKRLQAVSAAASTGGGGGAGAVGGAPRDQDPSAVATLVSGGGAGEGGGVGGAVVAVPTCGAAESSTLTRVAVAAGGLSRAAALVSRYQAYADGGSDDDVSRSASTSKARPAGDAAAVAADVTQADFDAAWLSTRPSCSERDYRRLQQTYDQFQHRGRRQADAATAPAAGPGSRATMA